MACIAALEQPLVPDDLVDIMRGAAPDPAFAGFQAGILADLRMPQDARRGDATSVGLFRRHAVHFGELWNRVVSVADRFSTYLSMPWLTETYVVRRFVHDPWEDFVSLEDQRRALRSLGQHPLVRKYLSMRSARESWQQKVAGLRIPELYDRIRMRTKSQIAACVRFIEKHGDMNPSDMRQRGCTHRVWGLYRPECIHGVEVLLDRQPHVAELLHALRNGVKTRAYRETLSAGINKSRVGFHTRNREFAPVAGAALSWSEEHDGSDVQWHDGATGGSVRDEGAWWGPKRKLPFDSHVGLMLAAGLSHDETVATWPKCMSLRDPNTMQRMGPAQAVLVTLQHTEEILRSTFFQALRQRVQKSPPARAE